MVFSPAGQRIEQEASGFHARVVQHEIDHLDGVLFTMRMTDLRLLSFNEEIRTLSARVPKRPQRRSRSPARMTTPQARAPSRERLLLATLPHVPFDGWTPEALAAGASDLGFTPVDAKRFFPGGVTELVGYFSDWADAQMTAALAGNDGVAPRLRIGSNARCASGSKALAPHREAARSAVVFFALPVNAPLGARCLHRTIDRIWYAVGDRPADFSYYTKRALLAAVYAATAMFWFEDRSVGHAETWRFLDRRIADVMRLQVLRSRADRAVNGLPNPLRILGWVAPPR